MLIAPAPATSTAPTTGAPLGFFWRRILGGGLRSTLQSDLDNLVATAERHSLPA